MTPRTIARKANTVRPGDTLVLLTGTHFRYEPIVGVTNSPNGTVITYLDTSGGAGRNTLSETRPYRPNEKVLTRRTR